jgi:drug/metabolite transporter (DMT)-like permease
LGIVNTALAFTLWIHSLEELRAFETAILQNTMLIQIALLSMMFLSETLSFNKLIGIVLVLSGVLLAQKRTKREKR